MNIAIVGFGVAGRLAALELAAKHKVSIFTEPSTNKPIAAEVAAAMLAPYAELETSDKEIFSLGIESMPLWQKITCNLGISEAYHHTGSLLVAHRQDMTELMHTIAQLERKLEKKESSQLKECDTDQLRELEPSLTNFTQAIFFQNEGYIDNTMFLEASTKYIIQKAELRYEKVKHLAAKKVVTHLGTYEFDWVIDCRGMGARTDIENLRGVRGEVIRLYAPEVEITRPIRLMHPRYKLYVVPRPNNCYIIGATSIESDDTSQVSVRSCLELLTAAYSLHSGFAEARITSLETSLRPTMPNNAPLITQSTGLTRINGLYRHGYLIGPAVVTKAIAQLL